MKIRTHDYIGAVVLGVALLLFLNIIVRAGLRPRGPSLPKELTELKSAPDSVEAVAPMRKQETPSAPAFEPRLELLGTIMGNPSMAFIYDPETDRRGLYKPNDTIGAVRVASIESGKVFVEKDGIYREIFLSARSPGPAQTASPAFAQDENGTLIISKFQVVAEMMKANETLAKVKIQPLPDAETNKLRGFRIDNVPSGSIIEAAGIHDGDVICSVQGQQLQSMQDALRMFNRVQNQSRIEVTLLRGDQPITLKYEIKN